MGGRVRSGGVGWWQDYGYSGALTAGATIVSSTTALLLSRKFTNADHDRADRLAEEERRRVDASIRAEAIRSVLVEMKQFVSDCQNFSNALAVAMVNAPTVTSPHTLLLRDRDLASVHGIASRQMLAASVAIDLVVEEDVRSALADTVRASADLLDRIVSCRDAATGVALRNELRDVMLGVVLATDSAGDTYRELRRAAS